jgi:hypothetical protein
VDFSQAVPVHTQYCGGHIVSDLKFPQLALAPPPHAQQASAALTPLVACEAMLPHSFKSQVGPLPPSGVHQPLVVYAAQS